MGGCMGPVCHLRIFVKDMRAKLDSSIRLPMCFMTRLHHGCFLSTCTDFVF